ncbi:MAG: hypothetical protein ACT4TC_09445, partial [Myxococcaceae bacterium]
MLPLVLALLATSPCEDALTDVNALQRAEEALQVKLRRADESDWTFEAIRKPAEERLTLACALRAVPGSSPDRERLKTILSRDEFAQSKEGAFRVIGALIGHWLEQFFRSSGAVGFAEITRVLVLALAFVVLIAGALRMWSARRRRTLPAPLLSSPSLLRPPPEHLANARAALGTAPREALREALLALLSALERARL